MKDQNTKTILETLAEKIRELELEVSLKDYEITKLKEEKAELIKQRGALFREENKHG